MTAGLCVLPHNQPAETAAGSLLCPHHEAALNELLADILDLVHLLPWFWLPGSSPDRSGRRRTKAAEAPTPARLEIIAMTDPRSALDEPELDPYLNLNADGRLVSNGATIPPYQAWLDERTEWVIDQRGLDGSTWQRGDITSTIRFLQAHREWIHQQDWVNEYWDELRLIRRTLINVTEGQPVPVGLCPIMDGDGQECRAPLWPDEDGAMAVHCSGRPSHEIGETMLRHLGGMLEAS